jgi:methylated-DNA-[protein]-cysteine S-methyltransferase
MKYVVFKTRWGWFGLLAGRQGLIRTFLPVPTKLKAQAGLSMGWDSPVFDKSLYKPLQDKIAAYFEGETVIFSTFRSVFLQNLTPFTSLVLLACRGVPYGRTSTYLALAEAIGRPKAVRAVANALAGNPLPLIIPCHRVIQSDGQIGGFSAPGGTRTKSKLIELEKRILSGEKRV